MSGDTPCFKKKLHYNSGPLPEDEACFLKNLLYVSIVKNLMYAMLYTRTDIFYAVEMISQFQKNLGKILGSREIYFQVLEKYMRLCPSV